MIKTKINLSGVPETMLWPLYNRACEQKRSNRMLEDPMSLELMEQIDYDFEQFGKFNAGHPLRSRVFDDAVKEWLEKYPKGTVVSLGEGLDTQFWRVDNGKMTWASVDVPEAITMREWFLPANNRIKHIPCSALDFKWLKEISKDTPVFIILAGIIMYFTKPEAKSLLKQIVSHFKDYEIILDMIPEGYSKKTLKGMQVTKTYKAPPMPFGLNFDDCIELVDLHPELDLKKQISYTDVFPERMRPYSYFRKIKWVRNTMAPWMIHLKKW